MNFHAAVQAIVSRDPRYKPDAYEFVMQALWFTQKRLKPKASAGKADVTGQELLEGIRDFAREQYGPMAKVVFEHWGVTTTADFGEIVFHMVEAGVMGKTERDSRDDFKDYYNFDDAFDFFKVKSR